MEVWKQPARMASGVRDQMVALFGNIYPLAACELLSNRK